MGFIHFVVLILGCCVSIGNACSCPENRQPWNAICAADFAFRGTLITWRFYTNLQRVAYKKSLLFNITQEFKIPDGARLLGRGRNQIIMYLRTSAQCEVIFPQNVEVFVVANYEDDGTVWTTRCLPNQVWGQLNTGQLHVLSSMETLQSFCIVRKTMFTLSEKMQYLFPHIHVHLK